MEKANFSFYDSIVNVRQRDSEACFKSLLRTLQRNGYAVTLHPRIEKHYKSLSKYHRYVSKPTPNGLFECEAEWYPSGMKFECYQNIVFENPNGGQYDFQKLSKMPFLIRIQFLHFRNIVSQYLIKKELDFQPSLRDGATPLERFNDSWKPDRFRRGADGWPDESELKHWRQVTQDGVPITQGMRAYSLHYNKRWVTGRLFGGINGMWMLYGSQNNMIDNHNAGHYFAHPTHVCRGRVIESDRDKRALRRKLDKAYELNDFKAISRLAKAAERILTSAI